jgi:hypothetical protein
MKYAPFTVGENTGEGPMIQRAWQVISLTLYGRKKQARRKGSAMKSPKDVHPSSVKRTFTTKDELKLVCKKIADMDALWRSCDSSEPQPLKRAA